MVSLLSHVSLLECLSIFLIPRQETGGRNFARFCIGQSLRLLTPGILWKNQVTPKIQVEQRGSVPARLPQIPSAFMDASCQLHPCRPCTANSPLLMSNIFIPCRLNHACSDHCLLLQLQPSHGASAVVSRHWSHLCVCGMEGRTKAK